MKLNKVVAIPVLAIAAGIGLAACGTNTHTVIIKTAPAVTHTVTAPASKAAPVKTTPAPAKTVIVQPAPAPPAQSEPINTSALTFCGSGVFIGTGTTCAFALDVHSAYIAGGYWNQPGTSYFYVDGQSMTSASVGNPVIVTDGSGDLIEFND
jgi:hypothetical protein